MCFRQIQSIIFAMTVVSIATRVESTHFKIDDYIEIRQKLSKKTSVEITLAPKHAKRGPSSSSVKKGTGASTTVASKSTKRASAAKGGASIVTPRSAKKPIIIDTTNQDVFAEFDFSMSLSFSDFLGVTDNNESKIPKKGVTSKKLRTGKSGSRRKQPSSRPTHIPSPSPSTLEPSKSPTFTPTMEPTTLEPTLVPSPLPTNEPSNSPSTELPTIVPTLDDSSSIFPFSDVPTTSFTDEPTGRFTDEPTILPTPSATFLVPLPAGDDDDAFIEQNNTDGNGDDIFDDDLSGGGNNNVTDDDISVPDTSVGGDNDTNVTPFIAGVVGLFVLILGSLAVFRKKKRSGESRPSENTV
ncbi:unnamed protein product [Cylindrotheca closterium]|uniref:Uncharacterized protein n=1 Tax=Cylindrotheca closterium TaxID=2856 RepID=A0AAD2FJ31_9STRA|nr:unnamed protein product [Cylindrotheca closterium]